MLVGTINKNVIAPGTINDHLNTVRQYGQQKSLQTVDNPNQFSTSSNAPSSPHASGAHSKSGVIALNSTRAAPASKTKMVDSNLSSLRAEHDSTAASKGHRFPMSADEAFKMLNPLLW